MDMSQLLTVPSYICSKLPALPHPILPRKTRKKGREPSFPLCLLPPGGSRCFPVWPGMAWHDTQGLATGITCSFKAVVSEPVTSPCLTKANPRYKSRKMCLAGFGVILVSCLYVVFQLVTITVFS